MNTQNPQHESTQQKKPTSAKQIVCKPLLPTGFLVANRNRETQKNLFCSFFRNFRKTPNSCSINMNTPLPNTTIIQTYTRPSQTTRKYV